MTLLLFFLCNKTQIRNKVMGESQNDVFRYSCGGFGSGFQSGICLFPCSPAGTIEQVSSNFTKLLF